MLATLFVKTTSSSDQWPSNVVNLKQSIWHTSLLIQFGFHFRENILKLKEEFYKPRDLAEDDELENIIDAILKQKAMAMDTGYVADVCK